MRYMIYGVVSQETYKAVFMTFSESTCKENKRQGTKSLA